MILNKYGGWKCSPTVTKSTNLSRCKIAKHPRLMCMVHRGLLLASYVISSRVIGQWYNCLGVTRSLRRIWANRQPQSYSTTVKQNETVYMLCGMYCSCTLIARFMGPAWDQSGADRTLVDPMLGPETLLSGWVLSQNTFCLAEWWCCCMF